MENSREAELSELRMRLLLTSGKKMMKKIDALMPIRKDEAVEAAYINFKNDFSRILSLESSFLGKALEDDFKK
jgi:hypothetical protein